MFWKAYKIKAVAQLSLCAIAFYVLILLWIRTWSRAAITHEEISRFYLESVDI